MKIKINSIFGKVLFEGDFSSLVEALKAAVLSGANLSGANLYGANLSGANLSGANLYGANLYGAKSAELVIAQTRILPEGELIGWKKLQGGKIAKLVIPRDAKRSHAFGRKCRAEFALVETIFDGEKTVDSGHSKHEPGFVYEVGKVVRPTIKFDTDWQEECASGIHFFITRVEAENY